MGAPGAAGKELKDPVTLLRWKRGVLMGSRHIAWRRLQKLQRMWRIGLPQENTCLIPHTRNAKSLWSWWLRQSVNARMSKEDKDVY